MTKPYKKSLLRLMVRRPTILSFEDESQIGYSKTYLCYYSSNSHSLARSQFETHFQNFHDYFSKKTKFALGNFSQTELVCWILYLQGRLR